MKENKPPVNKGKKYPPEVLSPEEITALLKAPSNRAPTGIRNKAMLYLGYRAGLRLSEVLALYPEDVATDKGIVRLLHGKKDKTRTVGLPPDACVALDRWLDKRKKLKLNNRVPLFCTLDGKPLKDAYVRAVMKRLRDRAGITKRVHFHGLRDTYARELAKYGVPMPFIQKSLGHTSLQTTHRYLRHVAPTDATVAIKSSDERKMMITLKVNTGESSFHVYNNGEPIGHIMMQRGLTGDKYLASIKRHGQKDTGGKEFDSPDEALQWIEIHQ